MQKIYKKLGILAHEIAKVKVAWSLRLLFQIGFAVSWTILTALFVETFGIQNLVIFFLTDAALFIAGTILASFVLPRLELNKFLLATIFSTLFFLTVALLFSGHNLWFFIFAILAKDLFFAQLNIALYRQNESFFSPAEAQKVMPIIESAITIGAIFGAFLTISFLEIVATKFVLILWAAALILMAAVIFFLPKILRDVPHFLETRKNNFKNPLAESWAGLKKHNFLKHIFAILILQSAIFTVVDFQFTKSVQSHISPANHAAAHDSHGEHLKASIFQDFTEKLKEVKNFTEKSIETASTKLIAHETLAHDLGAFHLIFGVFALIVQLLVTSRILENFGIIGAVISYFSILFFALFAASFRLISVGLLRGLQHGAHSIGDSAYHISFYSIFEHGRESVRLFLEGIVKPLGIFLGVFVLFIFHENFVFILPAAMAAGIVAVSIFAKKSFTKLSFENLQNEENISNKLHAIEVLKQRGHARAALILVEELQKENLHPVVKSKIIATIAKINDPRVVHSFTEILNSDESDEVKIKILDSFLEFKNLQTFWNDHAFAQYHLMKAIKNLFSKTENLHLKKVLIMNIFKYSPSHEVVPFFLQTMRSTDEELKAICLRSCTIFNDPDIAFYLRPYLMHPSSRLRGHAVIALWKFEAQEKLRKIIHSFLRDDEDDETEDVESKISGIYSIGEIGDKKSEEKLFEFIHHANSEVKLHALVALAKLKNELSIPMIVDILINAESKLSRKIHGMLDRLPPEIREKIEMEIQFEVSRRALNILKPQKVRRIEDLPRVPKSLLEYLRRLYFLAGKHDDFLRIENVLGR
jgi:hypothetical protein